MFNRHLKKRFAFSDGNPIWRVVISDDDKLILETRDTDMKEAYYHCVEIETGKNLWTGYQLDEKYWVGIEEVSAGKIFFHKYAKPDMPEHKGIIAVDIISRNTVWTNDDLTFLFVLNGKAYAYKQKFETQDFFALDAKTGEIINTLGNDFELISNLQDNAERVKDYSDYKFPQRYYGDIEPDSVKELINGAVSDVDIIGDVEYTSYEGLVMISYHHGEKENLTNDFIVIDTQKRKQIFKETLNANSGVIIPDSFFVYKNILFLIRDKKKLIAYDIDI